MARLNLKWGISDLIAYYVGEATFQNFANMLGFLPGVQAVISLVRPTQEAFDYALMASYQMTGQAISANIGEQLTRLEGIDDTLCQYDNLKYLILTAHSIVPYLRVALVFILIPNGFQ